MAADRPKMDDSDVPGWDIIIPALQSLLQNYKLDLSTVGRGNRDFSVFEPIFHHIFTILDPQETRRRFWDCYPSRNAIDRVNFVHKCVSIINEKKWFPGRVSVSASTMNMCGGSPFRRLLSHLIMRAIDKETDKITSLLEPLQDNDLKAKDLDLCYERVRNEIDGMFEEMENLLSSGQDYSNEKIKLVDQISITWEPLARSFLKYDEVPVFDVSLFKLVYKKYLETVEKNRHKIATLVTSINQMQLPLDDTEPIDQRKARSRESKRVSDLIRDMHKLLSPEPGDKDTFEVGKSTEWLLDQLQKYDRHIKELAIDCERVVEELERNLLNDPNFRAKYELFQRTVPLVDAKPIFSTDLPKLDLECLKEVLGKYLDSSKYNVEEVLDFARERCGNFENTSKCRL